METPSSYIVEQLSKHKDELSRIKVGNREIGPDEPAFIVAEAACNHMCDLSLALEMIEKASDAGADAIKFQTYKAEKLVTKDAVAFWGDEKMTQIEYYRRLDRFGKEEYETLFKAAEDRGIIPFSSPFDLESADMLFDIGMQVFKIASCDINNLQNLEHIARFGRPIMLSTGASSLDEIDRAVETIFGQNNYQLMLLACTLSYPTENEDANLSRIQSLRQRYPGVIIGLSDHTKPDDSMVIPSVGVALGAKIIEKHYTLDCSMTGSGHFFAVDPAHLKKMVSNIRLTETVIGDGELGVAQSEKKAWESARRSIVAERDILKGSVIAKEDLGFKRPGTGLPASSYSEIIGRTAVIDIKADQMIHFDMFK